MADKPNLQSQYVIDFDDLKQLDKYAINPRPNGILKVGLGEFHNIENINKAELAFLNEKQEDGTLLVQGNAVTLTLNYNWERGHHDDDHQQDVQQTSYLYRNAGGEIVKAYVAQDAELKEIEPTAEEKERMGKIDGLPIEQPKIAAEVDVIEHPDLDPKPIKPAMPATETSAQPEPSSAVTSVIPPISTILSPKEIAAAQLSLGSVVEEEPAVTAAAQPKMQLPAKEETENAAKDMAENLTGKASADYQRLLTRYEKDGISANELKDLKTFSELAKKSEANEALSKDELAKLSEFQSEISQSLQPKSVESTLPATSKLMGVQPLQ